MTNSPSWRKEKLADPHPSYTPPETLDEKSKKVLKSVLNADGTSNRCRSSP
jgi:hypothetical protein